MKILFPLLIFLNFRICELSPQTKSVNCDLKDGDIVWHCFQNEDNSWNLTMDCLANNNNKESAEIQLWSSLFPNQMKALTLQNCDKLTVKTSCNAEKELINFRYLEIKNISNLILGGKNESKFSEITFPSYYPNYGKRRFETTLTDGILPTFTTFENIQNLTLTSYLNSPDFKKNCKNKNHVFESLELKSVTLDGLKTNFIGYSSNLTNFLMDNVTISNVEGTSIITINNTEAMVKIFNSKFPDVNTYLMNCSADEVILLNNTFGHLTGLMKLFGDKLPALTIKATKFSLIGNIIPFWGPHTFRIESSVITISKNTFGQIRDFNTDTMIVLPPNKTTVKYSFFDNVLQTLNKRAFTYTVWNEQSHLFDLFNVLNNSVDCSCASFSWFDYMGRHELDSFRSHIQLYKWFGENNDNRCLNLPYCSLNQVLYNFEELCDDEYTCLEMDVPFNLKNSKPVFDDLLSSLNRIEALNSKMLNVMTNGSYNEEIKEKKVNNVVKLKKVDAEALSSKSQNVLPYQEQIYQCLVLISCLSFFVFSYHVFITYKRCSPGKNHLFNSRTQSETELTL